jgi:hypothetical protein
MNRIFSPLFLVSAIFVFSFPTGSIFAAFVVTLEQVGSDVVATGSGTLDTDALTGNGSGGVQSTIFPTVGAVMVGPVPGGGATQFLGITGPSDFGAGAESFPTSGSGDLVGLTGGFGGSLFAPIGYQSGAFLSDTSTYAGQTLSSLGITQGTYTWSWGQGPTADSFTLVAAPEPSSLALAALGGVALLAYRRRLRRN